MAAVEWNIPVVVLTLGSGDAVLQDWTQHSAVCKPKANVKRSAVAAEDQQDVGGEMGDSGSASTALTIRAQGSQGAADGDTAAGRGYVLELPSPFGAIRLCSSSATASQMRQIEDLYEEFVATRGQELLDNWDWDDV